jgi:hypothetical protein
VLGPVNRPGAEVGAHISYQNLTFRDLVKWEVVELEALNRFVVAIVEIRSVGIDLPLLWLRNPRV